MVFPVGYGSYSSFVVVLLPRGSPCRPYDSRELALSPIISAGEAYPLGLRFPDLVLTLGIIVVTFFFIGAISRFCASTNGIGSGLALGVSLKCLQPVVDEDAFDFKFFRVAIFFFFWSGSIALAGDSLIVDGHSQSSVLVEIVPLVLVLI